MHIKLVSTLAVALTMSMVVYLSFSLRSASAQGAGGASMAPDGAGVATLADSEAPAVPEEIVPEDVGGCCSNAETPCAEAMFERPCKDLKITERAACIQEQVQECMAKRREMMQEKHPCAMSVISRPCKDMKGSRRAECIKEELETCKARFSGE